MLKRVLYLVIFFLTSFAAVAQSRKELKKDAENARETKDEFFIDLRNGKRIKYSSLKLKITLTNGDYLEGDNKKIDIPHDSIKAYQTEKFYVEYFYDRKNMYINGRYYAFVNGQRIRNGKIELFTTSVYSSGAYGSGGGGSERTYLVRKGKDGEIFVLSKEILRQLISDNKSLLEEFDKMYKKAREYESSTKIIDEYN